MKANNPMPAFFKIYFFREQMKKLSLPFYLLPLIILSCDNKDGPDIPVKGYILGNLTIITENAGILPDRSGVQVTIHNENSDFEAETDHSGSFGFMDVPFGTYSIDLVKPGFLVSNDMITTEQPDITFELSAEKDTVKLAFGMYEIPDVTYHLDSGIFDPQDMAEIYIYGSIEGDGNYADTVYYYHQVICFIDSIAGVSNENYFTYRFGIWTEWYPDTTRYIHTHEIPDLRSFDKDSVYIRIYPVTKGDDPFAPLRREAMGLPSNIIRIPLK